MENMGWEMNLGTTMEELEAREAAVAEAVAERKAQFEPAWRKILELASRT